MNSKGLFIKKVHGEGVAQFGQGVRGILQM